MRPMHALLALGLSLSLTACAGVSTPSTVGSLDLAQGLYDTASMYTETAILVGETACSGPLGTLEPERCSIYMDAAQRLRAAASGLGAALDAARIARDAGHGGDYHIALNEALRAYSHAERALNEARAIARELRVAD